MEIVVTAVVAFLVGGAVGVLWGRRRRAAPAVVSNDELSKVALDFHRLSSELESSQRQLAEKNLQLHQASELKSRFLATVSHELRTPLTSIIGYCDLLRDGLSGPLNSAQRDVLDTLARHASALLRLINDLIDIRRIESDNLKLDKGEVVLAECLEHALRVVEPQLLAKNLELKVDLPDTLVLLWADFDRLAQVFINLLGNAVKFTEAGTVGIRCDVEGERVRLEFWDTGIGVKPAQCEHIFDEFRQADEGIERAYGGTGLGLAISRKLLALHDGTIQALPRAEGGSVFRVSLPLMAPAAVTK